MHTLVVIGVVTGLWAAVVLLVLAACRAARRGDEALMNDRPSVAPAQTEIARDRAAPRRVRMPVPATRRRSRLH